MDNTQQNQNPTTYTTVDGIFPGQPPIDYPKEPGFTPKEYCPVGGVILAEGDIEYNKYRRTCKVKVRNTGDRPVQIGSHFHFFEVNRYIEFDREKAWGMHLNIPATTAVRLEPGEEKEVELVDYNGKRRVIGFNDLANGYTGYEDKPTFYPKHIRATQFMKEYGFKCISEEEADAEFTETEVNNATKKG